VPPQAPLIGAHVSVAGGLATGGLRCAAAVGAEVIQLFVTNPRAWATPPGHPGQDEALRTAQLPIYVHASYLSNLGSAGGAARSIPALAHALGRGAEIGAGQIGPGPLGELVRHPALAAAPFIVETPGGESAHAADVAALKAERR
jgi:endonuclease IV